MKKHLVNILLVLILLTGFSLLLYPTFSEYWNSLHQSRAITNYNQSIAALDETDYTQLWQAALDYNASLLTKPNRFFMTEEEREIYESMLRVSSDVMGYIEIPKIECRLAIYHGTEESVLQVGVGHIESSSLPTGGLGTHCVLSGHRGLPSAKLFTNLDRMTEGDVFMIMVLNETLTYEVDQILVVEPEDVSALEIDPAQDYCTLVTCTPYGINSHRLLVRGHRIETVEEAEKIHVTAEAEAVSQGRVAAVLAVPAVLLWILTNIFRRKR